MGAGDSRELVTQANDRRPQIVLIANTNPKYGKEFKVTFKVASALAGVTFHLYAPPFVTHTCSMNQRMLILGSTAAVVAGGQCVSTVFAPPVLSQLLPVTTC